MSDSPLRFTAVAGYLLGERMASGGMGTVHLGLKTGALGFQRIVAIKRLHAHLAEDPEFGARFKDEIRLASRLSHTNIVQTLDVVEATGELMLVMECVEGETLSTLLADTRAAGRVLPIEVATGVLIQALHGLHAAHEARDDAGRDLNLVHRDFSPHNLMINKDGLVKVLDFGIAKAAFESHVTRTGHVCGKFAYISPEQLRGQTVDRRADIFSAGVVLWEALTCERLFGSEKADVAALRNIIHKRVPAPSELRPGISPALDRIVLRALSRDPSKRFESARDFAFALETICSSAPASALARTLEACCQPRMTRKALAIAEFRKDVTQRMSLAPRSALELADAVSGVHEFETRDIQGGVVADSRSRAGSRWHRLGLVVSGVLLLSLCLLARRTWLQGGSPRAKVAPTVAASPVPSGQSPSLSIHAAAATPSPSSSGVELMELPVESAGDVQGEPRPSRPSRQRRNAARPIASTVAAPVASPCSPPTYTDDEGIRHFKVGCI